MITVSLSGEKYDELIRCISLVREECNDLDIRDGMIRQRTNDISAVFELDLSPLIPGLNLPLTNLKQKIDLLKCFAEREVEITVDERDFSFTDEYSTLRFDTPNLEFMDNKFMPDEEMDSVFTVDESDLLLTCSIEKVISERMKIITAGFNVNNIQVVFNGTDASITTRSQSKDQHAKLVSGIFADREINAVTNIVAIPFVIDHDGDMTFKMYNIQDNVCMNMISTAISDIDINVYCRSNLVNPEEA
jgi:hypothetical protein